MRVEVLKAVRMTMLFWVVMLSRLIGRYCDATYESTWCQNPEEHLRQNLESII
jgi:hypothetical protein